MMLYGINATVNTEARIYIIHYYLMWTNSYMPTSWRH